MRIIRAYALELFAVLSYALMSFHAGAAPATPPPAGTNYQLNAVITNTPPAVVAIVTSTPTFSELASNNPFGEVYTDGSGKIDGVEDMVFTNLDLTCGSFTSGDFVTRITGSISTVGRSNTVMVTMNMKGNGYVQNDTGSTQSSASLNLSFTCKLIPTNSAVVTTGTFVEIGTNAGGAAFTNVYTYLPETNYTFVSAYQTLDVIYLTETSDTFTTNVLGTNTVLIQDQICQNDCQVKFGIPTGTTNTTPFSTCLCSNILTNLVVIGTNITYRSIGTNIIAGHTRTNYIFGLSITNLQEYIDAVAGCNTMNGTGIVQTVTTLLTNTIAASSTTNVTLWASITAPVGNPCSPTTNSVKTTFSNSWFEVDASLKGRITASRCEQNFNGVNASLSLPFTSYTTFIGSGSNTSGPFFGFDCPLVSATDAGVLYVVAANVANNDLQVVPADGSFSSATIKQFGNDIYASASGAFYGQGLINARKQTYRLALSGIGFLQGCSLVVTGATGVDIVGYTLETNILAFTNFAAVPPVVGFVTNTTFFNSSTTFNVPGQTIANQSVGGGAYDFFTLSTNGLGTTNLIVTNVFICPAVTIPPVVITNTVDGLRSIFATGKVLGQKISVSGTNADIAYPVP
jgi:hypothetical protein